ncbi:hypothetical protein [Salininema proteolyticum]|uniref:Uncharacterized protein n=1 Tax=Salininema proteolyticum TaxID=1607685 RepID=A0ABV8U187_9ACTN
MINDLSDVAVALGAIITITALYIVAIVLSHRDERNACAVCRRSHAAMGRVASKNCIRTDGTVLGSVSFLARTFEVREVDVWSAVVIAVEPGGRRLIIAEVDWYQGYPGRVFWSPDPARHALLGDHSRLLFALEQRVRAVIDRSVFGEDLPPRFGEEIRALNPHQNSTQEEIRGRALSSA